MCVCVCKLLKQRSTPSVWFWHEVGDSHGRVMFFLVNTGADCCTLCPISDVHQHRMTDQHFQRRNLSIADWRWHLRTFFCLHANNLSLTRVMKVVLTGVLVYIYLQCGSRLLTVDTHFYWMLCHNRLGVSSFLLKYRSKPQSLAFHINITCYHVCAFEYIRCRQGRYLHRC